MWPFFGLFYGRVGEFTFVFRRAQFHERAKKVRPPGKEYQPNNLNGTRKSVARMFEGMIEERRANRFNRPTNSIEPIF